jgi:hypothetical protein
MRAHGKKNLLQNIAITVLAVSAVLLFARTQLDNLSVGSLSELLSSAPSAAPAAQAEALTDLAVPVRMAVTGAYGRYGDLWLTTAGQEFAAPGALLGEALGSAGASAACTEADLRQALRGTSIYYDFEADLPLSVLAGLLGTDLAPEGLSARVAVLSAAGDGVALYLQGEAGCSRFTTALTGAALEKLVNSYQLGNVSFAFELGGDAEALAPDNLLLTGDLPDFPVLTASVPTGTSSGLLSALGINPHTNSRYPESSGAEVVMDGDRTVRLQTDGTVVYQDGGESAAVHISAEEADSPTDREAVLGAARLLAQMVQPGDAALCLHAVQRTGVTRVIQFDYVLNGTPIRLSSGGHAAEVTLSGDAVTGFTLLLRRYQAGQNPSLLLPLRQALAVAAQHPGAELVVCYTDGGGSAVSAQWLAE